MVCKVSSLYGFLFFLGAIAFGLVAEQGYFSFVLAVFVYFYIGKFVDSRSSVHMMFFLGFSVFMFLPALLNWYYLDIDFFIFFVSSFVALMFLFMTRKTVVKEFIDYGRPLKIIFLVLCLIASVSVVSGLGYYVRPTIAFLIMLLSLCFVQGSFKNNLFYLLVFACFFIIYTMIFWDGFGRTVLIGWLLLAMLQFAYSTGIKINKYAFGLLPGASAALMSNRDFLKLEFHGFESALNDSAYGPYRLASSFISDFNQRGFDFLGFWDQIIFTFLVFIPRAIWPNKPFGFGFEYTVRHLDDYLVDAGHSIASTLIGDHIYFLGYLGVITSLLIFALIAFATNALYKIKGLNGNGVLVFSASMMVLVWGGMTSFSARIIMPSIIFVLLFTVFRRFLTRRIKFVWGSSS